MDHWPDVDRCRKLKKAKYPQGKTMFNYVCVGGSWIIDLTKRGDGLQRCAAPIVTELLAEIIALTGGERVSCKYAIDRERNIMKWFTNTQVADPSKDGFAAEADTLPNALADLWLWLRGREK